MKFIYFRNQISAAGKHSRFVSFCFKSPVEKYHRFLTATEIGPRQAQLAAGRRQARGAWSHVSYCPSALNVVSHRLLFSNNNNDIAAVNTNYRKLVTHTCRSTTIDNSSIYFKVNNCHAKRKCFLHLQCFWSAQLTLTICYIVLT